MRENPPNATESAAAADTQPKAADGTVRSVARGQRAREPSIEADTRLNAIVVQDIPDRIPIYRKLIEQLDVPSTLVEIEAMIVDVNSEAIDELGVTWGANIGKASLGYGNLTLSPTGGLPLDSAAKLSPGTLGLSISSSLVARVRALQSRGAANILSQPSIFTADNLGAMIDLSETFYIRTRSERVATVTPVVVGTSLRVTPRYIHSTGSRQVELTVDIEDGSIQDEAKVEGLPTVRKSNISTLAVVGDQQTLLIGGYNSSQNKESVEKVPFLGDIPGLGALFSSKSKNVQRRSRLFLIRPRLVAIDGQVVGEVESPIVARNPSMGTALSVSWGQQSGETAGQYLDRTHGEMLMRMVGVRSAVLHSTPAMTKPKAPIEQPRPAEVMPAAPPALAIPVPEVGSSPRQQGTQDSMPAVPPLPGSGAVPKGGSTDWNAPWYGGA